MMTRPRQPSVFRALALAAMLLCLRGLAAGPAGEAEEARLRLLVDEAVRPVMARHQIAGLAVGLVTGENRHLYYYGVAATDSGRPVGPDTLFELGSVTKTYTASLAAWAEERGALRLTEPVERYLPELRGSEFGRVPLLALATHTPGGLPLQVPAEVRDESQLLSYLRGWHATTPPGTLRTYGNPGIGTLGLVAARALGRDFPTLLEQELFPALGLKDSFVRIPENRRPDYAQGYTREGRPVRQRPGVLTDEAYGVRSTASDLLRFVEVNLGLVDPEPRLRRAIQATHRGYYRVGPLVQDLIWEQYPYPVELRTLVEGNSPALIFGATPAIALLPPLEPQRDAWLNKTGSTDGFGAYVAFIPGKQRGIVILANRNYPIEERVTLAYRILAALP
jgi:beta-lactamase class C